MDYLQALVLAFIQGLTEFLPISSAAHLILLPRLFGWQDQGLAFDISVHVGSLLAVLVYFRHDLRPMARDWLVHVRGGASTDMARLAWAVVFATLPAALVGLAFKEFVNTSLRGPLVIATATIFFGLVLWAADVSGRRLRDEHTITWRDIVLVGCAQALALIPGTSRSGITITAGLLLGLTRDAAARFSFLLSIPIILLAGGHTFAQLLQSGETVRWGILFVGTVLSGVTAYTCIHLFLKAIEKVSMLPFVIYRLLLGVFLFYLFL